MTVRAGDEALEVVVDLSPAFAGRLLDPAAPPPLTAETFPPNRPALLAAASRVCTLVDAGGAAIAPSRVLVSTDARGEVRFLCLYPADARPARLRMPALQALPAGYFCLLADETASPARRHVLLKESPEHALGPVTAPAP